MCKPLLRLGKFNIFWAGEGNDALKAPHHNRVEGKADNDLSDLLLLEKADA